MKPQKNTRGMLPQSSTSAMLTDVLDPRRQKEKPNPRRKRGKKPPIINMPPDPDAPIQSIELPSGSPSATHSCNNDTQNLPPKLLPTPIFCERGVLFGYWYQDPAGNVSRHPVYACPKEREFTVKRRGRIEPVRIDDFDELDVFEESVTALFRADTDRRQKAVNYKLWRFVILL
jgi:hypothetical protein